MSTDTINPAIMIVGLIAAQEVLTPPEASARLKVQSGTTYASR